MKPPAASPSVAKREAADALRKAVDAQQRFGIREDCRSHCEALWEAAVEAIAKIKGAK